MGSPSLISLMVSQCGRQYLKATLNYVVFKKVPGEIKRSRDLRGGRWCWTFKLAQTSREVELG